MKLNKENAYVGAEVKKGNDKFYILKVNDKSFYASTLSDVVKKWENRLKGVTFKNFIAGNSCKKYDYEGFQIDEKIAEKKEIVEKKQERKSKIKRFLKREEERFLIDTIKKFERDNPARHPIEVSNKTVIYPIVFNKNNRQILFRKEMEYIIYSADIDEYKKWGNHGEIEAKEKNIPWFD